jgi:hypothetical protein
MFPPSKKCLNQPRSAHPEKVSSLSDLVPPAGQKTATENLNDEAKSLGELTDPLVFFGL